MTPLRESWDIKEVKYILSRSTINQFIEYKIVFME